MKKMMMGLLILLAANSANALVEIGSCGLPTFIDADDSNYQDIEYTDLSRGNVRITKKQAREILEATTFLSGQKFTSVSKALEDLREGSEGGDVIHETFKYGRVTYTQVKSWPGGNPVGLIFKNGKAVAFNGDDSIECFSDAPPRKVIKPVRPGQGKK